LQQISDEVVGYTTASSAVYFRMQ